MYYVYILRCRDGTLYTGSTPDLQRRLAAHIAAAWVTAEKSDALRLEYAVKKRLDRAQKLELIARPEALAERWPELAALFERVAEEENHG